MYSWKSSLSNSLKPVLLIIIISSYISAQSIHIGSLLSVLFNVREIPCQLYSESFAFVLVKKFFYRTHFVLNRSERFCIITQLSCIPQQNSWQNTTRFDRRKRYEFPNEHMFYFQWLLFLKYISYIIIPSFIQLFADASQ